VLCSVTALDDTDGVQLVVSGPFALFRRTVVYGRALASLLGRAARCQQFDLRALCALSASHAPQHYQGSSDTSQLVPVRMRSGDPIVPAGALPSYDSKLEERFARDFAKLTDDWELLREPQPVAAGTTTFFPDFALRHRRRNHPDILLEIVGFWTPEYLAKKLSDLHAAGLERLILCIDSQRNCSPDDLPPGAEVIRYTRRVPAAEVLARLQRWA